MFELNFNICLVIGNYSGKAHSIVVAERVVLNFMQRMSGIATLTQVLYIVITDMRYYLDDLAEFGFLYNV